MVVSMFERLQELPLLMGLSVNDLMNIVEKVNFDFGKYTEGSTLISQGDRCSRVIYVLNGIVCADHREAERNLMISEYIDDTPFALELQNLWGMRQYFEHTYMFTTDGSTCSIDKRQLAQLISNYDIVKTNLLSMVCNRLQMAVSQSKRSIPESTEDRLKNFLDSYFLTKKGRKIIRVKMENLANILNTPRINISRVLNTWEEKGLVEVLRGRFVIHNTEKLYYE